MLATNTRITAADGNKNVLIMKSSTTVRLALASTLIIFKSKQNKQKLANVLRKDFKR